MTDHLLEIDNEEADTQHGRYLTFLLENECYGIEIQHVLEIVGMQKINTLPDSPDFAKGIINLRGNIIPVVDMRVRFHKKAGAYTDRTCIVVIEVCDNTIGLIVDQVEEVVSIPDESIVPPPDYHTGYQNRYLRGVGKTADDIRLIIDCERLFHEEELPELPVQTN